LNRPDEIPKIHKYALDHGAGATDYKPVHEEQLRISRRMREALVKAGAISGQGKLDPSASSFTFD